jgi:membrane-associated phospholipid phosphatase
MRKWLLAGLYLVGLAAYFPLSHRTFGFSSYTFLDAYIPLIQSFVIPYLSLPVFLLVALLALWRTRYGEMYLVALVIAQWTAVLFWLLVPTAIVRPGIIDNNLFAHLISYVYTHDGTVNQFPSSHVFLSLISGYFLVRAYPRWRVVTIILALAIVASTVLIKQHSVTDVAGGLLWAAASIALAFSLLTRYRAGRVRLSSLARRGNSLTS